MVKFLSSVWCTLIISVAFGTVFFLILSKWIGGNELAIMSLSVTIIIFLMTQKLLVEREAAKNKKIDDDNLTRQLSQKASIEYVDRQDNHIMAMLNQHMAESRCANDTMMKLINSIDEKLNRLLAK